MVDVKKVKMGQTQGNADIKEKIHPPKFSLKPTCDLCMTRCIHFLGLWQEGITNWVTYITEIRSLTILGTSSPEPRVSWATQPSSEGSRKASSLASSPWHSLTCRCITSHGGPLPPHTCISVSRFSSFHKDTTHIGFRIGLITSS